jgi:hypothetical protein
VDELFIDKSPIGFNESTYYAVQLIGLMVAAMQRHSLTPLTQTTTNKLYSCVFLRKSLNMLQLQKSDVLSFRQLMFVIG